MCLEKGIEWKDQHPWEEKFQELGNVTVRFGEPLNTWEESMQNIKKDEPGNDHSHSGDSDVESYFIVFASSPLSGRSALFGASQLANLSWFKRIHELHTSAYSLSVPHVFLCLVPAV